MAGFTPGTLRGFDYNPAKAMACLTSMATWTATETAGATTRTARRSSSTNRPNETQRDRSRNELWKRATNAIGTACHGVRERGRRQTSARWLEGVRCRCGATAGSPTPDGENFLHHSGSIGGSNYTMFNRPSSTRSTKVKTMPDSPENAPRALPQDDFSPVGYTTVAREFREARSILVQPWLIGYRRHPFAHEPWRYLDIDLAKLAAAKHWRQMMFTIVMGGSEGSHPSTDEMRSLRCASEPARTRSGMTVQRNGARRHGTMTLTEKPGTLGCVLTATLLIALGIQWPGGAGGLPIRRIGRGCLVSNDTAPCTRHHFTESRESPSRPGLDRPVRLINNRKGVPNGGRRAPVSDCPLAAVISIVWAGVIKRLSRAPDSGTSPASTLTGGLAPTISAGATPPTKSSRSAGQVTGSDLELVLGRYHPRPPAEAREDAASGTLAASWLGLRRAGDILTVPARAEAVLA